MKEADVRKNYPASFEKKLIDKASLRSLTQTRRWLASRLRRSFTLTKTAGWSKLICRYPMNRCRRFRGFRGGVVLCCCNNGLRSTRRKYGLAIAQDGRCDVAAIDKALLAGSKVKIFVCKSLWRSQGQTINMYCTIRSGRLSSLALIYKPLESDI